MRALGAAWGDGPALRVTRQRVGVPRVSHSCTAAAHFWPSSMAVTPPRVARGPNNRPVTGLEVDHLEVGPPTEELLGEHSPVALGRILLQAKERGGRRRVELVGQGVELVGCRLLDVRAEALAPLRHPAVLEEPAQIGRRAERAAVLIGDAVLRKQGAEPRLRHALPAGLRPVAHVDEPADARVLELGRERAGQQPLVADGPEPRAHRSSVSGIARRGRAGVPIRSVRGGAWSRTIDPAPIIASSPTSTPGETITFAPIRQARRSTTPVAGGPSPERPIVSSVRTTTPGPITASSSITVRVATTASLKRRMPAPSVQSGPSATFRPSIVPAPTVVSSRTRPRSPT